MKKMPSNLHEQDPISNLGRKLQEEQTEQMFRKTREWGLLEGLIQKRIARWLLGGLPRLLWTYSRTAFLLYFAAFAFYVLFVAAFTTALYTQFPYAIGLYFFAILFVASMVGVMIYGFRKTHGFVRIVSAIQTGSAVIFT